MRDNQDLANDIGTRLRAAETALADGNPVQAQVELAALHADLGQAFVAVNIILDAAGMAPLDWSGIAGGGQPGGDATRSGGGPKEPPTPDE